MKNITIYTTSNCAYCRMAKSFFGENNIPYQEKNVEGDREALREMMDKSGQLGVPVIDVDGAIIVGFDQPKLKELIGI